LLRRRREKKVLKRRRQAVIDLTYYLSQILLSVVMGPLVEWTGLPHFYIIVSALCAFGAAASSTKVVFEPIECK
jgi:hypothetical protein